MRLFHVEKYAKKQHPADAIDLRTVGVFGCFDFRVMLAMHSDPFASDHSCCEPEPQAEEMTDRRVQVECAVSLVPMQINCDRDDCDVGERHYDEHISPPWQIQYSGIKHAFSIHCAYCNSNMFAEIGKVCIDLRQAGVAKTVRRKMFARFSTQS